MLLDHSEGEGTANLLQKPASRAVWDRGGLPGCRWAGHVVHSYSSLVVWWVEDDSLVERGAAHQLSLVCRLTGPTTTRCARPPGFH